MEHDCIVNHRWQSDTVYISYTERWERQNAAVFDKAISNGGNWHVNVYDIQKKKKKQKKKTNKQKKKKQKKKTKKKNNETNPVHNYYKYAI